MTTFQESSNSTTLRSSEPDPDDSTLYSNRLIGLAISADSEISTQRRLDLKNKKSSAVAEARELKTALHVLENITSGPPLGPQELKRVIKKETQRSLGLESCGPSFSKSKSPGVTIRPCGSLPPDDMSSDGEMPRSSLSTSSSSQGRVSRSPQNCLPSLNQGTKLITVFSSPVPHFYTGLSRKKGREGGELPEYVKLMMEKDSSLRKLVKTGCVTISRIKAEESGSDDSGKWDTDDYVYEENNSSNTCEESQDSKEINGHARPYEPPANIGDWIEYPFAKKLLEFTYQSITTTESKFENQSKSKGFSSPSSNSYPGSSTSSNRDSEFSHFSIPQNSSRTIQSLKPRKKPNRADARMSTPSSFYTSQSTKKRRRALALSKKHKGNGLGGRSSGGNNVPSKDVSVDSSSSPAYDSIDPTSFLEVSLQEMTVPDDSHRRKYKCIHCSKAFCWSTDLKRHILIHTGERPFQCSQCPANFTRKFLMQKHLKKVHGQSTADPTLGPPELDPTSSSVNGNGTTVEDLFKYEEGELEAEEYDETESENGLQYLLTQENSEDEEGSRGDVDEPMTSSYNDNEDLKIENDEDEPAFSGDDNPEHEQSEFAY